MTNFLQTADNAYARALSNQLNNTTTPLTITGIDTTRLPAVTTGYALTIYDDKTYQLASDDPQMEKVLVTAATISVTGSLTLTRSNPKAHVGTPILALLVIAQHINDLGNAINVSESTIATKKSIISPQLNRTASFTAVAGNIYTVDASAGNVTVTFPASTTGQEFQIKKLDANATPTATAGRVILSGTINGNTGATISLRKQGQAKQVVADGTGGWIISLGDIDITQLGATTTEQGFVMLAGDLSGTNVSPTVPGLLTKQPNLIVTTVQTTSFTASTGNLYPVDASAGMVTVTLPTSGAGQIINVIKNDSSTNFVNVTGKINGIAATTVNFKLLNEEKSFIPDGTGGWWVASGNYGLSSLDARYQPAGGAKAVTINSSTTTALTAVSGTKYRVDATSGAVTITLPSTNGAGDTIVVQKSDTTSNLVSVMGKIDGISSTTDNLRTQNQGKIYQGDGNGNWIVIAGDVSVGALDLRYQMLLNETPTKTAAYTALSNEFVIADATSGAFSVTLPSAPSNKTIIGVKKIDTSTNIVTVSLSGTDTFTIGGTTLSLSVQGHAAIFQYNATTGKWTATSNDVPLASLDNRYVNLTTAQSVAGAKTWTSAQVVRGDSGNTYSPLQLQTSTGAPIFKFTNTNTDAVPSAYIDFYRGATSVGQLQVGTNGMFFSSVTQTDFAVAGTTKFRVGATDSIIYTNLIPGTNATYAIGQSGNYYTNSYVSRQYLNSTTYFDGATAGVAALTGSMTSSSYIGALGTGLPETTTTAGTYIGRVDTPRLLFANGTASQNWQIDNYNGVFRWYLPNSTKMQLDSSGSLSSPNTFTVTSDGLFATSNNTKSIGSSSTYWANIYATRYYLNSTAYLDGATSGSITVTGNVGVGGLNANYPFTIQGANTTNNLWMFKNNTGADKWHMTIVGGTDLNFAQSGVLDGRLYLQAGGNVGLSTTAPTHTLTIPSIGTGIALYNTSDQTTNYERAVMQWSANEFSINTVSAGTGTQRFLNFGGVRLGNGFIRSASGALITGYLDVNFTQSYTRIYATHTQTSGIAYTAVVNPTINQSSTAGYTALLVNPTETATGSGTKLLADFQVGGVSKANITNQGEIIGVSNVVAGSYFKGAGVQTGVQIVTGNVTLVPNTSSELLLVNASSAAINVTLNATTGAGIRFTIKKTDSSANAVTITPTSGTIDGQASVSLATQYKFITIISTPTSGVWYTVGNN